jgi:DNA-binding NtrC family response regulator
MKTKHRKFKVLLCLKKDLIEFSRQAVIKGSDVHLQFTPSPRFLMSRAIFSAPNMVLIDASFDRMLLVDILATFRLQFSDIPVFLVSSSKNHQDAVDVMSLGASGYFALPGDARRLSERAKALLSEWQMEHTQQRISELQHTAYNFDQIIGNTPQLLRLLDRAKKIIANPLLTVLITGETGTGKELLARAIHYNGKYHASPFVDIGCSSLPENLLESELFGYEKGAFTDAREKKLGLFELAADGSIFLDEIGDISAAMQSKLLKVIESRTMRRLGGLKDIPVRARIIAATSVDLAAKMKSGQFRKDLYHRLKIIPLEIPSLRDRREDISLLVESFIKTLNPLYEKKICGISPGALSILKAQEWEGNIRELKHTIERAVLLEEGDILSEKNFEFFSGQNPSGIVSHQQHQDESSQFGHHVHEAPLSLTIPLEEASLEDIQRQFALKVLDRTKGNKSKAAYVLRISRPRLDRILNNEKE